LPDEARAGSAPRNITTQTSSSDALNGIQADFVALHNSCKMAQVDYFLTTPMVELNGSFVRVQHVSTGTP